MINLLLLFLLGQASFLKPEATEQEIMAHTTRLQETNMKNWDELIAADIELVNHIADDHEENPSIVQVNYERTADEIAYPVIFTGQ